MSRRENRRLYLEAKNKEVLRKDRRWAELWRIQRENTNKIKLEEPIRSGWEKTFVVRPDLLRSEKGQILTKLLKLVNNTIVCNRKDFKYKAHFGKRQWKEMVHKLNDITPKQFEELDRKEQAYFEPVYRRKYSSKPYKMYEFKYHWMYVPVVKPHYIYELDLIEPDVISEIDIIGTHLFDFREIYKFGNSRDNGWDSYRYKRADFKQETKHLIDEDFKDAA